MDETPLSPRTTRILLLGVGATLIVGTIAWSMLTPGQDQGAAEPEQPAAAPSAPTARELGPEQVLGWLPYTAAELADAGNVAVAYAERAHSIDYAADTDGAAQREDLVELSTAEHARTLEAASSAAAARQELADAGTVTTATAVVEHIDRWGAGTVTLVLSVATTTTDDDGASADTAQTAITLTGPSGWQVAAVADPGVGQGGDTAATAPADDGDQE